MGFPSFIQELLIPGLVALFAAAIVGIEYGLVGPDDLEDASSLVATAVLTGALVAAYLIGIGLRHVGWRLVPWLIPSSSTLYRRRLEARWPEELDQLSERWMKAAPSPARRSEEAALDDDLAYYIVNRMAYYHLGHLGDGWSNRLAYHRSIARVAGNSLVSLSLLAIACVAATVPNLASSDLGVATVYLAAGCFVASLAWVLRQTFESRMFWYVDALVMTDLGPGA